MKNNLYLGLEATEKLMNGVRIAASVVGSTMGTSGKNVLLEALERPGFFPTNDGATILNAIHLEDSLEEMGRKIISEAVSRANRTSGDGSSTTTVICAAILEEGMKYMDEASPMDIKRSLEACIPIIEKSLQKQRISITVDEVSPVAAISSEDPGIGDRLQEIYQKIGKDGIIQWDVSKTPYDSYAIGTGINIPEATYVTQYMCDDNSTEVRLADVPVLLMRQKITSGLEFEKIFPPLYEQNYRDILIFCEDIEVQALVHLVNTKQVRGFRAVVVKMPTLWSDEWWEDLQKASGAKIVDKTSGINLETATTAILGRFGKVTISKEGTVIEGIQDISKHIMALKVDGSDRALQRAERLNTQTARYFVGAHSESALAYRRLKVEDAINSASCALENGILPGGGTALLNCLNDLPLDEIGGKILGVAVASPFSRIVSNTGKDPKKEYGELVKMAPTYGFDSKTGTLVDMREKGIVDAYDVVLNAVTSAIGTAASILTVGSVVLLNKEP